MTTPKQSGRFAMLKEIIGRLIRGVPPGATPATAGQDRPQRFVCGTDLTDDQIATAVQAGELRPWRIDADGRQWFERPAEIQAFAPVDAGGAGDDDDAGDAYELDPLTADDPVGDHETGEKVFNASLILRNAKNRNRARELADRLLFGTDEDDQ